MPVQLGQAVYRAEGWEVLPDIHRKEKLPIKRTATIMQDVFRVKVPYAIKYTTAHPVPIAEIVDSLQSLEKLIKRTPAFVEAAFDGIKVFETNVYVEKIESGSLYQRLVVELVRSEEHTSELQSRPH